MTSISLPAADGAWRDLELCEPADWSPHPEPFRSRVAFAAAHVVADPRGDNVPGAPAAVDWDETLAFRRHLLRYGMGIAEAMDTAQRNMGLDWEAAKELIARSSAQADELNGRIASGAGTDHRPDAADLASVLNAYVEQVEIVEDAGSQVIVMASRQLAAVATSEADYRQVYDEVFERVGAPVILHWLGEMFDPNLAGYWGSADRDSATDAFVRLVNDHADRIDGVKVSLLSAEHEIGLRRRLPDGVRLYTGDDFNYLDLIRGDGTHHSDALLGALSAIAPAAAAAFAALDDGGVAEYEAILAPTVPLSRHIFEPPTYYYKTGIAFISWLSGFQSGFTMVAGLQSARSIVHLTELFALANTARLLPDPELAAARMTSVLSVAGLVR